MLRIIYILTLLISCQQLMARQISVKEPPVNNPEWTKTYAPFRIAGNLYYVGTYDLASYLITTNEGHILINTGVASSAGSIKNSIEKLGFRFSDIKILLTTQAHYDHLGAMAAIQQQTGAQFMVNRPDSAVVTDGGFSDYAFGGQVSFAPIPISRVLQDKDTITLGNTRLVMLSHPGHTKGSCSYLLTTSAAKGKSYRVLIANMPSIVTDKKLDEVSNYPQIAQDYAYTLAAMRQLSFDLWVASHASQFDLHKKHKPGSSYRPEAFRDREGYDKSLDELQASYDRHIKK